jgi:hypothetical protein
VKHSVQAQKGPYGAAIPVIIGVVGGAFAMSAAFAMAATTRPDRPAAIAAPAKTQTAASVAAHMAPASQDPALKMLTFSMPVPGFAINSPFGMRRMPWEEGGRLHEGVDIAAPAGAKVAATLRGTVTRTGLSFSYGRYVEVEHEGGLVSFYAHLGGWPKGIKQGVAVSAGQHIGFVGNSGRSTGSHLHFEIRRNDKPLNPAMFIGRTFASADQLPLKDAAKVGRTRVAVVANWPASAKPAAKSAPGVAVQPAADGRVRAVIQPSGPIEIVARDPVKAAEARARLRAMQDAGGPELMVKEVNKPAPKAAPAKPSADDQDGPVRTAAPAA